LAEKRKLVFIKFKLLMNKTFLLFSIFLNISLLNTFSQESTTVSISNEKVLIDGKIYYLHTVGNGETLDLIAKVYNVTAKDILDCNKSLTSDIKVGQLIKVPIVPRQNQNLLVKTDSSIQQKIHVVLPGQTLYSISKLYNVPIEEIINENHLSSDTIKINQKLIIPINKTIAPKTKDTLDLKNFIIHIVEEKETLYSISRKYKVSIDDILRNNEDVASKGLKKGTDIRIPIQNLEITSRIPNDSLKPISIITPTVDCNTLDYKIKNNKIVVSLLLPFNTKGVADTEEEDSNSPYKNTVNPLSANFIEFYQGILIAADELKKEGYILTINTFDTQKDTLAINEILKNKEFEKSNIIIGPIYGDQVRMVSSFVQKKEIYTIIPVGNYEETINSNPYIFQIQPNIEEEFKTISKLLNADSVEKIIVIYPKYESETTNNKLKNILYEEFKENIGKLIEIYSSVSDLNNALDNLDSLKNNFVICPSTDEIFVTSLLSQIESRLILYRVQTIGRPEWTNFINIDQNYLYHQKLTVISPYYLDYNNENIINYLKIYRKYFGTEPFRRSKGGFNYSMLGYDIFKHFVKSYSILGRDMNKYINCIKNPDLLNVDFLFKENSPNGCLINTKLNTIYYQKNFSIYHTR